MITISVVSHGHGEMVECLVRKILIYPEVTRIIVTKNIPEILNLIISDRITIIENSTQRGFGENHNEAFYRSSDALFCVLNPDILFTENPFPTLIHALSEYKADLAVPLVLSPAGAVDDSIRFFPTPFGLILRVFNKESKYCITKNSTPFSPEWAAGMFMLFRSEAFAILDGFDKGYYLYYEDVDICVRLWNAGLKIIACPSTSVIHYAQRASRRSFKFAQWHLRSMMRYFVIHCSNLPSINRKI